MLQAGIPLARAQKAFADADQMIPLDPPFGEGDAATIGGVIATGDSGPLRHRYGGPRDVILGARVALGDGTIARSGGKVIKNVAGYDLPKLFTGSFGTLGVIVEVVMRLQPHAPGTATGQGFSSDPDALARAASAVGHSPLEVQCLDVAWQRGQGSVMARFGGAAASEPARRAAELMEEAGAETEVVEDDDDIWRRQRDGQRSATGVVARVSGLASELANVLRTAEALEASVVGRAGLGLSWLILEGEDVDELLSRVAEVRRRLHPFACVVLDAPQQVRAKTDVWDEDDPGRLALMRRVKARFDPDGVCNPGIFVGGI